MSEAATNDPSRGRLVLRVVLLVLLLAVAAVLAVRAVRQVRTLAAVDEVCEAVGAADYDAAVEASGEMERLFAASLKRSSDAASRLVECRCAALSARGEELQCRREVAELLLDEHGVGWAPQRPLLVTGVDQLLADERPREAWRAIQRARQASGSPDLLRELELVARLRFEPEEVARQVTAARQRGEALPPEIVYTVVAESLSGSRPEEAIELLGPAPGAEASAEVVDRWYALRSGAEAQRGSLQGVVGALDAWRRRGLGEEEYRARLGLLAGNWWLTSSERQIELLTAALPGEERLEDPDLAVLVRSRLVRILASQGQLERALRLYDDSIERHGRLVGLDREELVRLRLESRDERAGERATSSATLVVDGLRGGDRLRLSPPPGAAADAELSELVARGSSLVVERPAGERPLWWLVRDAENRIVGRGTVWLTPGARSTVVLERRDQAASAPHTEPAVPARPTAGDGRRRVVLVLLDSADWRIVRYLLAADEVPVLARLLELGTRAVMLSDPPYTAAALAKLISPGADTFGLVELFHQLGQEVEALDFVGRNPVSFLEALLPGNQNLFEVVGAGERQALNLLQAVGAVSEERNATLIGPGGERRVQGGLQGTRQLTAEEIAAIPGLERDLESDSGRHLGEAAGELDNVLAVLRGGEVDLIAARVASLDLVTHATFGPLAEEGQHDGDLALLRFYRYLDLRLGEVLRAIDADDLLVVASDHGARTSFEHDEESLFVAVGPGLAGGGRVEEDLSIDGMGWWIARALGFERDWPRGGFESLAGAAAAELSRGGAEPSDG
ncbi:MAG: hypothetical protein DWQ36_22485 [Acidobacteria bacterium]|nr:MAG: hypothetical protein DWQ30_13785 [Acidobacteriota bacterium]REK00531.1 MAG: hypothetical protein DWQ36_22485 [Acidobacteriota bacterium]